MLHHLQGLVASDALDFLRGAAGLIKGRSSVLSQAMELDRAKSKTRLVTPPDGVEATLRQRLAVPSTDNIETLALHYHQFIGQQSVGPAQVPCAPRPAVIKSLSGEHKEEVVMRGIIDGRMLEI